MGFDCSYQGIPANSNLIHRAYYDQGFAENVFYPLITIANTLEKEYYYQNPEFNAVRELFMLYPDIKTWNYYPSSRMQDALIYILNPETYINAKGYQELEQTISFRSVKGERVFTEHLRATQGVHVRISSAEFIRRCLELFTSLSLKQLEDNFDVEKMLDLGIYKVGRACEYRYIENYFTGLIEYYRKMISLENMAIFVSED